MCRKKVHQRPCRRNRQKNKIFSRRLRIREKKHHSRVNLFCGSVWRPALIHWELCFLCRRSFSDISDLPDKSISTHFCIWPSLPVCLRSFGPMSFGTALLTRIQRPRRAIKESLKPCAISESQ